MWKSRRRLSWLSCALGRIDISDVHQKNKDWKKILPGLIISAIALAIVFSLVDLDQLGEALRLADYRFVGLVLFISLVWLTLRAMVWRTLLQEKASFSQTFLTINEGYLLNNILPFRLGEVGRAYLLGKKINLGFWQVFSTILIERALDIAFAAGILLATLPFVIAGDTAWAEQAAFVAGGMVLAGFLMIFLLARYRERAMRLFDRLAERFPILQRFTKQLRAFLNGLEILTKGRRFLRAIGLAALNWIVAIFQYYALLRAFFPGGELVWAAFSLGVVALGIAAPSSPGALGVFELAMVGALSLFGLEPSTALAMALIGHMSNYSMTGLIGAYALAQDGTSLARIYRSVKVIIPGDEGSRTR
jgi:uncharacterized protein (TIRG00374 family)